MNCSSCFAACGKLETSYCNSWSQGSVRGVGPLLGDALQSGGALSQGPNMWPGPLTLKYNHYSSILNMLVQTTIDSSFQSSF